MPLNLLNLLNPQRYVPREEWKGYVSPYRPVFMDGWSPSGFVDGAVDAPDNADDVEDDDEEEEFDKRRTGGGGFHHQQYGTDSETELQLVPPPPPMESPRRAGGKLHYNLFKRYTKILCSYKFSHYMTCVLVCGQYTRINTLDGI